MKKLNISIFFFLSFMAISIFIVSCSDDDDMSPTPTCSDNIQNQGETGVDCGGPCDACPTCEDGIQNGDETGVDCGGSCEPCLVFFEHITCEVNGEAYEANLVAGFDNLVELKFQSDQSQEIQFFFELPSGVDEGTYELVDNPGHLARYVDFPVGEYMTTAGTITITLNNTAMAELSGTFQFTAVYEEFGAPQDTVVITNGKFGVEYF